MTNTKFRKRALLSSVAMLLVALVALGSATFAWFAANPNAGVSTLNLKTTAATGLLCRTDFDPTFSHSAALYDSTVLDLQPVSGQGTFYTIDADYASAWGTTKTTASAASNPSWSTVGATAGTYTTGDYFMEKVYFCLSPGSATPAAGTKTVKLDSVSIDAATGSPTLLDAIRVTVCQSDGTVIGNYANATATSSGYYLSGTDYASDKTSLSLTAIASASNLALSTGIDGSSLTTSTTDYSNYVIVYVWLDGEDSKCFSDNVGSVNAAGIISGVSVNFTLA